MNCQEHTRVLGLTCGVGQEAASDDPEWETVLMPWLTAKNPVSARHPTLPPPISGGHGACVEQSECGRVDERG